MKSERSTRVSSEHPGVVSTEDLIAYVDGEASELVVAHVRSCATCTEEARHYAQLQQRLRRVVARVTCPSPHRLGEYQLGMLSPDEQLRIAAHLRDCPRCADERRTLQEFLDDESEPTTALTDRVRRLVATLVAPSTVPAMGGVRGSDAPSQTYRAGTVTLNVRTEVEVPRKRVVLDGLIWFDREAPLPLGGRTVALVDPTGATYRAVTDEQGNFSFDDITPGTYRLELRVDDQIVVVEQLPVGA